MQKYIFFFTTLFVIGCGGGSNNNTSHPEAKGGKVYGGMLHINETDEYVSLYPHLVTDAISLNIASQIYEGLVRFNPKNITQILPCIAERWDIDADGVVYTFHLKKDVKFHDDECFQKGKGREVTAADFKYSFKLLCTASEDNSLFESSFMGRVKGADTYYENSKKGESAADLEGVKVIDDYTLQITLVSPSNTFLYMLAGSAGYVFPHEAVEKYGNKTVVGTGPFMLNNLNITDNIILIRNPTYHRNDSIGNPLPFLDSILISFIPEKNKELDAFKQGDLHLIFGLPAASISEMVEQQITDFSSKHPKYYLYRNPELLTQYYQFNITRKPFDSPKVRYAFSYAIDRDKIISDVLNTEAFGPGICGLVPPGISEYDITEIKGYHFNPEKARKLLVEAGYPDGKGFPKVMIELNHGGGKHTEVVEEIKKQLREVLNIDVDFIVVPFAQKLEDAKYGKAEIFRSAWIADYPSPENFLRNLFGGSMSDSLHLPSYPNTVRYKNPAFDSLFLMGFRAKTQQEAYKYFLQAETILMQDAPVLILWYGESLAVMHSFVKNFYLNPMNYKDFSEVYIIKENIPSTP